MSERGSALFVVLHCQCMTVPSLKRMLVHDLAQERSSTDWIDTCQYQGNFSWDFHTLYRTFPSPFGSQMEKTFWALPLVPAIINFIFLLAPPLSRSPRLAEMQQISVHLQNTGKWPGPTFLSMLEDVPIPFLDFPVSKNWNSKDFAPMGKPVLTFRHETTLSLKYFLNVVYVPLSLPDTSPGTWEIHNMNWRCSHLQFSFSLWSEHNWWGNRNADAASVHLQREKAAKCLSP